MVLCPKGDPLFFAAPLAGTIKTAASPVVDMAHIGRGANWARQSGADPSAAYEVRGIWVNLCTYEHCEKEMTQPSDAASHALLAQAATLWVKGKPGAALPLYEQAVAALLPEESAAHHIEVRRAHALCLCEVKGAALALALYPGLHQLCTDWGVDDTEVLRQWAKGQEQSGDFAAARKTYERAVPKDSTPPVDRLKWRHAMGLLNWRDARLSEARENLRTATELMPTDAREASKLLAVLGNDALLSLELEDTGRALRLADQMHEIGQAGCAIPLSSQINLVRVRAALARRRGDTAAEVAVLKEGLALLERQARQDWMRRLDLTNDSDQSLCRGRPENRFAGQRYSRIGSSM